MRWQEERSELCGTLQSAARHHRQAERHRPEFKNHHEGHKEAAKEIEHYQQRLRELQELLYADGRRSLLICLQALDAGGKDGTISHILGSMNPQGCKVVGFKQPSALELAHDFLWRIHRAVPARGEVTIFNLEGLKLTFPPPSVDIEHIRKEYHSAKKHSH